mgnify:CR=1 FL=1
MITPDKLFPLPQDVYLERGKPKSTREQYESFLKKVNNMKSSKWWLFFFVFLNKITLCQMN